MFNANIKCVPNSLKRKNLHDHNDEVDFQSQKRFISEKMANEFGMCRIQNEVPSVHALSPPIEKRYSRKRPLDELDMDEVSNDLKRLETSHTSTSFQQTTLQSPSPNSMQTKISVQNPVNNNNNMNNNNYNSSNVQNSRKGNYGYSNYFWNDMDSPKPVQNQGKDEYDTDDESDDQTGDNSSFYRAFFKDKTPVISTELPASINPLKNGYPDIPRLVPDPSKALVVYQPPELVILNYLKKKQEQTPTTQTSHTIQQEEEMDEMDTSSASF